MTETVEKFEWEDRTPMKGELVMKLRGTDMGEKGVITEIKENGKLKLLKVGNEKLYFVFYLFTIFLYSGK